MSWLYSIVFAGLMFSSGGDIPFESPSVRSTETVVHAVTQDETEKGEQSYPISANGRVSVSTINGSGGR